MRKNTFKLEENDPETRYFHLEITVTCGPRDRGRVQAIQPPRLIVEVLSPTTELTDRTWKLKNYCVHPTIEEYVLVDSQSLHLDAPREVNVLLSDRTMQTWDAMFLDNIAREGILLYARGSLPAPLATRQSLQARLEDKGVIR